MRRITVITGHYGSGKTEFAINLALREARANAQNREYSGLAVCDLDLVNPYFRSRERRELLEAAGVSVFGSAYAEEITAEIPALGAAVRAPLENKSYRVIIDAGGNDSGALVLKQFRKYFTEAETDVIAVVNFKRYETLTVERAAEQIEAIERAAGLRAGYLVNNTHLLRETTAETVLRGHALASELARSLGKILLYDCFPAPVVSPDELREIQAILFPLALHMRPAWLDR
ncbi:MAG: ATP-binding protein [Oscillospiraceae bacterium]|jgi:hypothetical protein|nr:ATP-binding protein [Oscillospiraceae bacterium]